MNEARTPDELRRLGRSRDTSPMLFEVADTIEELRNVLRELVALKDLKDECTRRRGRRPLSVTRVFPKDLLDAEADYNKRKPIAWAAARALIKELQS